MKSNELTTLVKSVKIEGLFEMFDYDVKYPTSENVLIITGPNGFGKTQVLNIIFNLFNRKFLFFNKLKVRQVQQFGHFYGLSIYQVQFYEQARTYQSSLINYQRFLLNN